MLNNIIKYFPFDKNYGISAEYSDILNNAHEGLPHTPVNLNDLCNQLGIALIGSYDLPHGYSAELCRQVNETWKIIYNANEPYYRQRFVVAHELAHYLISSSFNC